ncbi:uncharacterized protein LOC131952563 [Physella acuta]|uniref:uncharacterized protein LOC131952563 n=1 Tax=Physella acuta TaxID=109671 RepID=UPI0027DAE317|nr:uncharacterized protein LOC131952563 [Physella acuta]
MSAYLIVLLACVVAVCHVVFAAPVSQEVDVKKRSVDSVEKQPQEQEDDLRDLLSLVGKESHQNNVVVHKEQVSHLENKGGEKTKVEEKEEKVVDAKTGNVIADVKQTVKEESSGSAKPETIVKTKVDIPSEGIHKTFVEEAGSDGVQAPEPELTPADMAEYLYTTQQFEAFYSALDRLVNQSKMSPEDAEIYAKTVAVEYERLQLADFEEKVFAEKRMYPKYALPEDVYIPNSNLDLLSSPNMANEELIAMNELAGYPYDVSPAEQYLMQQQEIANLGNEINLNEFLTALWNEAYGKGNEEAQEIVRMLYERVSQDNNPDDIGQIRDILVQTVADTLNDKAAVLPTDEDKVLKPAQKQLLKEKVEAVKSLEKEEELKKLATSKLVQEVKNDVKQTEKLQDAKSKSQKL